MTWPEARDASKRDAVLVIPIGATEQHGPHLPIDTDSRIALGLSDELAKRRGEVVVAPVLAYGSSGEHAGFTGTLSIGQAALELVVIELVRSADDWTSGVVLVCGHGGNAEPLARAVKLLTYEGRRVLVWFPQLDGADAHAGRAETSLMLAIAPELVRLELAEVGNTQPLSFLAPTLQTSSVQAVSPNGVLGDPRGASQTEGNQLLKTLADDLATKVAAW